jgi:hypothetical protein
MALRFDLLRLCWEWAALDDISTRRALAIPAALAAVTIALAAAISLHTGVTGSRVFVPYLGAWAASTLFSILIWVFVQVAILFPTRAENPVRAVAARISGPIRHAPLPAVIFPLFLGGYTWAKCSIPFAVGYGWEETWANADRLIFGMDAWRWSHGIMPDSLAPAWTFYYAMMWGFALVFSGTLISAFASRRFTATFFTAMMLSWLIGGIGLAYAMSAAGPVFAHLADPNLGAQFQPLHAELTRLLARDDSVLMSQRYLEAGAGMKAAVKGGGVSAMPSMHIATATILILAAWRTKWLPAAIIFWALTFFGSIYLGYHYAVDAPVAAAVAVICWVAARRMYGNAGVGSGGLGNDGRLG